MLLSSTPTTSSPQQLPAGCQAPSSGTSRVLFPAWRDRGWRAQLSPKTHALQLDTGDLESRLPGPSAGAAPALTRPPRPFSRPASPVCSRLRAPSHRLLRPGQRMEPGEPREPREPQEPREPGLEAEAAATPHWEKANSVAPKRKPKLVRAVDGSEGSGRERVTPRKRLPGPGRDPQRRSGRGRSLQTQNAPGTWRALGFISGALHWLCC